MPFLKVCAIPFYIREYSCPHIQESREIIQHLAVSTNTALKPQTTNNGVKICSPISTLFSFLPILHSFVTFTLALLLHLFYFYFYFYFYYYYYYYLLLHFYFYFYFYSYSYFLLLLFTLLFYF